MKRNLIMLLCILLIVSILTACGNNSQSSNEQKDNDLPNEDINKEINEDIDEDIDEEEIEDSTNEDDSINEEENSENQQNDNVEEQDELLNLVIENKWINDEQSDCYMIFDDEIISVGFGFDTASESQYVVDEINIEENYIILTILQERDLWENTINDVNYKSKIVIQDSEIKFINKYGKDNIESNWYIGEVQY